MTATGTRVCCNGRRRGRSGRPGGLGRRRVGSGVLLVMLAGAFGSPARAADSPEMDALRREIERLELESHRAQLERDRFKAELELREAILPEAPDGKISTDDEVSIAHQVLVHEALGAIAEEIARTIRQEAAEAGETVETVLLHDEAVMTALASYGTNELQMGELLDAYATLLDGRAELLAGALPAAGLVFRSLVDVAGLFRRDVSTEGFAVKLDDASVALTLLEKLGEGDPPIEVIHPGLLSSIVAKDAPTPKILRDLNTLRAEAVRAEVALSGLEAVAADKRSKEQRERIASLRKLNETTAAFLSRMSTPNAATGIAPHIQHARMESLVERLASDTSRILYCKVLAAGGSNTAVSSLFRSRLRLAGGVILGFALLELDGSVSTARVFYYVRSDQESAQERRRSKVVANFDLEPGK